MIEGRTFDLAGATHRCPCHACALVGSAEEENAVLLPFMAEGIAAGHRCVNIVDRNNRENRLASLAGAGIDVAGAQRSGQLELLAWEQAQILGGRFDMDGMLERWEAAADGAREARTTRFWSNMEWALQDLPGVGDLVEYESRFNRIWPKQNDVYICVYDTTKFDPLRLIQVFCAHPFVIVAGIFFLNPFYVPPDRYQKGSLTHLH